MPTDYRPPEVTERGPGEPEIAVVGGVHGDEPSGVHAVRRLRDADLDLQRGVAFVIANPSAVDAGRRYLDSDLNRIFPGDPDGDREHRLAARLCEIIEPLTTLSIHDTHSRPVPFALVHRSQPVEFDLASLLPVPQVVDHAGVNEGTITTCGTVVEVEVGAADVETGARMAERQARAFLQSVDALPGEPPRVDSHYFRMTEAIPKPNGVTAELFVENFEHVSEGTVYARTADRNFVAPEPFYPILASGDGYVDVLGYQGRKVAETLEGAHERLLAGNYGPEPRARRG